MRKQKPIWLAAIAGLSVVMIFTGARFASSNSGDMDASQVMETLQDSYVANWIEEIISINEEAGTVTVRLGARGEDMPQAVEYIAVVDLKEKRITEFREKVIECDPEVSPLTVEEENLAVQIAEEFPLFREVLVEGNMDIHTFDVRGVVARSSVKSEHRLAGVFFDCGDRAFLVNIDLTDQRGINVVLAKDYGTMASPYQRG